MAGMGPAPKPADQRRRANAPLANTVRLPAEGRQGPPPVWPMTGRTPKLWAELWALPQAVMWERMNLVRVVGRYVWSLRRAEEPDASPALLAEVRQFEDRLGLNPMALLRLRWEIEPAGEAQVVSLAPVRRRVVVVED